MSRAIVAGISHTDITWIILENGRHATCLSQESFFSVVILSVLQVVLSSLPLLFLLHHFQARAYIPILSQSCLAIISSRPESTLGPWQQWDCRQAWLFLKGKQEGCWPKTAWLTVAPPSLGASFIWTVQLSQHVWATTACLCVCCIMSWRRYQIL